MKTYNLGVLYGDGIGEEIVSATVDIIVAAAELSDEHVFNLEVLSMGETAIEEYDHPMPQYTKDRLKEKDGWIMGPHDSVAYPERFKEERNPSGELRSYFDLFANIRPAETIEGVKGVIKEADLVVFRENTEGYYPDRNMFQGLGEWMITPDVAISTGVFTRKAINRIARAAFDSAMKRKKKLTIVHKANVIRLGSGLFKQVCLEVAEEYPEVKVDDYHIDAMVAHLVRRPQDFDVLVTENMFGDIITDLMGELVGSLGLAPSINANDRQAMAQAAHGSAPDIAGKGLANPVGMIWSTVLLLEWMSEKHSDGGLMQIAQRVKSAMLLSLEQGQTTPDLGGKETTSSFAQVVIQKMREETVVS